MSLSFFTLYLSLFLNQVLAFPSGPKPPSHHAQPTCDNPAFPAYFDFSVKSRDAAPEKCPNVPQLFRRESADADDYSCSETKPCKNGACCPKATGYCNYGPDACGTNGESPNDVCWSNCDAHAECGRYAETPGTECPLNVCCSEFGFCGMTDDFCAKSDDTDKGCQSNCDQPKSGKSSGDVQKRIIGYYESWAHDRSCQGMDFKDIPVESLTHLNFAFGYITPGTFEIAPMEGVDASLFSDFTALKKRNSGLKATISLGGWSFNDNDTSTQPVFSNMVSSASNRQKFINNLFSFMRHYGFDGVDFDWEYPGAPDRGGHDDDGVNYTQFMKELQEAIAKQTEKYEVSFTAPTSYWYLRWFDLTNMMKHVDFMNLMSYDLHGVWDASDPIGSHVLAHTNLTEIKQSLDLLWRNDVDPGKVNLGLGFYGRSFQLADSSCWQPGCLFKGGANAGGCSKNSGTLTYKEIMDVIDTYNVAPYHDKENAVKYITWNKDQWVSYDDQETFQQKVKFANEQGLAGLLIWAVDQDTRDLAALRGVLYPNSLKTFNSEADDASYWEESGGGDCRVTECGGSCNPGEVPITKQPCGKSTGFWGGYHSDSADSTLCCPIDAAPDPKNCEWHGGAPLCDGQCDPGQVALESNKWGDGDYCNDGLKFYCCDIPEAKSIDCSWKDTCSSDETLMTFEGSFLETIADFSQFFGLVGEALAEVLDSYDLQAGKLFCCSNEEAKNWKNCEWAGTTGKGKDSCDDNHCATGHQVELAKSEYGEGQNCFPHLERTRAFCCDPASGKSPFLPVPLDYLFPNAPDEADADPEFKLETDDTWGTGKDQGTEGEPNKSAFGFVVITSPDEVQVSLDKRDGSHWEVFDCFDAVSEDEQTVRMVCTDYSEDSNCHKIHLGHGVPGTIVEMPEGCGPGKYAVAKNMTVSSNQELPNHLHKRDLVGREVYDLTFDYDFTRVPRDLGESLMRIDFSNEEGYWDSVVNKAGETKRKRSLEEVGKNHKRWLEDEWRDDVHFGALEKHELHKRWFGSDVISWLKNLVTTGTAKITEELNHQVDETVTAILVDEQWGPCPVGPANLQANIKAEISAHLQVDTSFGITIITTLDFPPDLSKSYLYFKNKGSVTASFSLDAIASLTYDSGDKKMIGLDDFPGATFRIPGIVTVGPNIAVYGSLSASFVVAGHLDAQVNIASWETQQTYPQESGYEPKSLDDPNRDGSQTLGTPEFNWEVSASGQVEIHLKPTVTFGIVFDARWKVPDASVNLVADGSMVFYATAAAGSDESTCPFKYGINAQAQLYAQLTAPDLFGWGGTTRIPIAEIPTKDITPGGKGEICPAQEPTKRDTLAINAPYPARDLVAVNHSRYVPSLDPWGNALPAALSLVEPAGSLVKRENHVIPAMFTIPDSFKKCPGSGGETPGEACELCYTIGLPEDDVSDDASSKARRALVERDGDDSTCPYIPPPEDALCTTATLSKRAVNVVKYYTWQGTKYPFSEYPQCGISNTDLQVAKWYMPQNARTTACTPAIVKNSIRNSDKTVDGISVSKFATDHVLEVGIITLFLEWLSGSRKIYANGGVIPFPTGWTAANTVWVEQVLGVGDNDGVQFQYGSNNWDWLDHVSTVALGSSSNGATGRAQLAVLLQDVNSVKRNWAQGNAVSPPSGTDSQLGATRDVRNSASVFQYLQHADIQPRWTRPSNEVEAICAAFDAANNWGSAPAGAVEPATTVAQPAGVTSWGLRTLWCYWIDNHLSRADANVATYLTTSQSVLSSFAGGQSQVAAHFIRDHITPATGLANANVMHFPRAANYAQRPLPGTAGSATSTSSRYMMWGDSRIGGTNNAFGPLGV
ncbi:Glycosyl hydrolases family 18 [Neofusicoccum parvum]|nr:Glycosyl hydrolases family 18 [Neofusicoccum parvum]